MFLEIAGFLFLLFLYFVFFSIILSIIYGFFLICFEIWWRFVDEPRRMKDIQAKIDDIEYPKFRF